VLVVLLGRGEAWYVAADSVVVFYDEGWEGYVRCACQPGFEGKGACAAWTAEMNLACVLSCLCCVMLAEQERRDAIIGHLFAGAFEWCRLCCVGGWGRANIHAYVCWLLRETHFACDCGVR
jgi:hypothetical protein